MPTQPQVLKTYTMNTTAGAGAAAVAGAATNASIQRAMQMPGPVPTAAVSIPQRNNRMDNRPTLQSQLQTHSLPLMAGITSPVPGLQSMAELSRVSLTPEFRASISGKGKKKKKKKKLNRAKINGQSPDGILQSTSLPNSPFHGPSRLNLNAAPHSTNISALVSPFTLNGPPNRFKNVNNGNNNTTNNAMNDYRYSHHHSFPEIP
eukprot:26188_1